MIETASETILLKGYGAKLGLNALFSSIDLSSSRLTWEIINLLVTSMSSASFRFSEC